MTPIVGQWTLGLYALILAVGGVIGFTKARSRKSLIGGVAGGLLALAALLLAYGGFVKTGFFLGASLALVMTLMFGMRLYETRKPMPAGPLIAISLAALVVMGLVIESL